jgi:two-component system osmolarity sensor histidine kinase EnvZ
LAKRSADDLAALMVLSAQSWVLLPHQARLDYSNKLYEEHEIWLTTPGEVIPPSDYLLPYMLRVEQSLKQRTGYALQLQPQLIEGRRWFWVDMPVAGQRVRIGFPRDRILTRPLTGFLVMLTASALLVLLTSMVLTRRITRPLTRLVEATQRLGAGQTPGPIPATEVRELDTLNRQFNRMALQVRELLDNRTTVLAGISHDLRTPITRMRLSLEMLSDSLDPELRERMLADLEQMDRLISESLELSRDLEGGHRERVDISLLVSGLIAELQTGQLAASIDWDEPASCQWSVNVTALSRILSNLIENALRYGEGKPVQVVLDGKARPPQLQVKDRGAGIPDEQKRAVFRPFYRLESSRSEETGGTGLGLAIVRQLVKANAMGLQLRDRQGGGTVFTLTLPGVDERSPSA